MSTITDETKPKMTAEKLRAMTMEANRKLSRPQEPVLDGRTPKTETSALVQDITQAIVALEQGSDPNTMRIGDYIAFRVSKIKGDPSGDDGIPTIFTDEWLMFKKGKTAKDEDAWVLLKEGRATKKVMPSMIKRSITIGVTFEVGKIYLIQFFDQKEISDGKKFNRAVVVHYEDWPQDWMRKRIEAIPKKAPRVKVETKPIIPSIDLPLDELAKGHPTAPPKTVTTDAYVVKTIHESTHTDGFALTQLGNSERLIARFGRYSLYIPAWKVWIIWDGKRWRIDDGTYMMFFAKAVVRDIANEKIENPREYEELERHATASERVGNIDAMVTLAGRQHSAKPEMLNADIYLLNVGNGTLDLRAFPFTFRDHEQRDLHTMITDVPYIPSAKGPLWDAMLAKVLPDPEVRKHFQKRVGAALTGDVSDRKFGTDWGQLARNGKSTIYRVLRKLGGEYATTVKFETFSTKMEGKVRNDLASLYKKRLVIAVESGADLDLDTNLMKSLTGEDEIRCRFLYKEDFTYYPEYHIFLATNNRPRISDADNSIWDRAQLTEWIYRFKDDEVIENYAETHLFPEMSGILNWALEGTRMWLEEGLKAPAAIVKSTEEYREREYPLSEFLDERCLVYSGPTTDVKNLAKGYGVTLFEAYQSWAVVAGIKRPYGRRRFYEILGMKFIQQVNAHNAVYFYGVRVK